MRAAALSFTARNSGNRLLDALSSRDLIDIERDVQIIMMKAHQPSLSAGQPMLHVHFPIDAVLSIIVTLNGQSIEVGTIGNESFVEGDAAFGAVLAARSTICQVEGRVGRMPIDVFQARLGSDSFARSTICQVEGRVGCMPIDVFQERLGSDSFARLMRNNVGASLYCTQQYLACNAKHSTLARCARWLLMTGDRAGRAQFTLNRDFLGIMLSVHEDEMRHVTDELTRLRAVTYSKADVSIVDAHLLEQISCECYASCKTAFANSLLD